ncbi:restriction endonuclease subunit S [Thiocapsa rosea]|uniref:Type I restriction enzyme S subunit n=1 Tax=Thiocapsa rosea TaxID=69360 RepID=A0A495VEV6_9GAMM|nr:restriction endonuclease subunit S [Thiocapsa rosea]RKT46927.1 type I restriction enzyme S subunit [Thiocapsa rosea]
MTWLPLARLDSSTGVPGLNRNDVYALTVNRPRAGERHKIAQVLNTLDTAIHDTEAIIAKLKAVKQGLLHDLLTRGIDANGELRPPQAEAPHLYKASPLGWIPNDWEASGLAAVAPRDRSVIRTGPFGSSLKGEHWRESGRPVVTIGSLGDAAFIASELLFVDDSTAARLAEFALIPGDIVFSRVADVGRSVVVLESERGWIMSSNLMRISCESAKAQPHFLQMLLSSSVMVRKQLRTTVNSAGRDVANSAVLMGLCFPWPSPTEQDQILSKARAVSDRLVYEEKDLKKLLDSKIGLMDDLLTGRVRVTPLLEAAP